MTDDLVAREAVMTPQTEAGKRLLVKYGLPVEADAEVVAIEAEARQAAEARIAVLEGALRMIVESAESYSTETMWGVYPVGLFGHIAEARTALSPEPK